MSRIADTFMEKELQELGLEEKEAQIYLACLAQNAPTPTLIAKLTGLKRATIYFYLDKLKEKNLIEWEIHKARKHISPVPPRRGLTWYVKKKKEEVERSEALIKGLLAEFERIPHNKTSDSKVYYYEGVESVRFAIGKLLASRKDIYWLGSMESMVSVTGEDWWYKTFTTKRLQQGTTTYGITDRRILQYPKFSEMKEGKRFFRFLEENFTIPAVLGVFGDSICLFSHDKNKLRLVLVENPLMAQTVRFLFKALWSALSRG